MQIKQNSQSLRVGYDLQDTQRVQGAKAPQVSIIVPIYNVASYLKECLQSIVRQSYTNLDIILVDDGSSDESLNIALEFAKKDERIFVISKPNGGLSYARNTGFEFIKGSALRGFVEKQNLIKSSFKKSEKDTKYTSSLQASNASAAKQGKAEVSLVIQDLQTLNVDCHAQQVALAMTSKVDCHDLPSKFRNDIKIQSFTQTHTFNKTYKDISEQDIQAHFTPIQPNFIKSDLERINEFIVQELPANALIHFVDSDDYIALDCIEKCVQNLLEKDLDILVHNLQEFDENTKEFKNGSYLNKLKQNEYNSGLELLVQNKI